MLEKRYQVFVSSTFIDLREERQRVVEALLQIDCIPVGMELFPAADEEQWNFIRRIIDACDYYVLVVAGRYGSLTPEGISYTEREFEYALEMGIPVLAFIHENPGVIASDKRELDKDAVARLENFKQRVKTGRIVKPWSTSGDLASQVVISLTKAFVSHPRRGWIRGGGPDSVTLLQEVNELRKNNQELEEALRQQQDRTRAASQNLATGTEKIALYGKVRAKYLANETSWREEVTWNRVLAIIGPKLLNHWHPENLLGEMLSRLLVGHKFPGLIQISLNESLLDSIKIQLMALGWIEVKSLKNQAGYMAPFWTLTSTGQGELIKIRSIRKSAHEAPESVQETPEPYSESQNEDLR